MPRSGSSLIEQILAQHAQIHGAGELKYLNYLLDNMKNKDNNHLIFPDDIMNLSSVEAETISHILT